MSSKKNTFDKSQRQLQVGEAIKRAICEVFIEKGLLSIDNCIISILQADASPDLKSVKIYLDIFGNDEKIKNQIIKNLNKFANSLCFEMLKKVNMRSAPQLMFVLDKTPQNVDKINQILIAEKNKDQQNQIKNNQK